MSSVHRPSVMVAVLIAAALIAVAAPAVDAYLPRARPYHVHGPITLDTNLRSASRVSAWAIDEYLRSRTALPRLGAVFLAAERKYGVNARFLLAAAMHESAWGRGAIARIKHNLFGYNAYDRDPFHYATAYATYAANINATAKFIRDEYLTPGGRWWGGQPTLRSMQQFWSSSHRWGENVSRIASSIHLRTLAGRAIDVATPVVRGLLHGGDRASVRLTWTGGAIPAGVTFVATWEPVEVPLDTTLATAPGVGNGEAGVLGGATPADVSATLPPAGPTAAAPARVAAKAIAARRSRTSARAITLTVAAPREPGDYLLQIEMRDSDQRPLPAAERVQIPGVAVRIWGDRAVSVDLAPALDGRGAALTITNTGRETIPAATGEQSANAGVPHAHGVRSLISVTATLDGADGPTPAMLLATPLAADLSPGASLTFDLPALDKPVGWATSRLSVRLTVLGDASWLPIPATSPTSSAAPISAAPPISAPPPTPTMSPTPSPTPAATPAARAHPKPHRTRYSEHSRSIVYRGRWGNATSGGYIGGNVAWSSTPGSTARFTFTGSSVTWIGPEGPTRGRALVLIDGRAVARVNLWRSSFVARAVLFTHAFRTAGRHTLTIRVLADPQHPYVAIDELRVRR